MKEMERKWSKNIFGEMERENRDKIDVEKIDRQIRVRARIRNRMKSEVRMQREKVERKCGERKLSEKVRRESGERN